jgi:hypothetical protein
LRITQLFGSSPNVRLGGTPCTSVPPPLDGYVQCTLPPGVGRGVVRARCSPARWRRARSTPDTQPAPLQTVTVVNNALFSAANTLLSYAAPTLTTVAGCTGSGAPRCRCNRRRHRCCPWQDPPQRTARAAAAFPSPSRCERSQAPGCECFRHPRASPQGNNFGRSDALVLVGGVACANVSHSATAPHQQLSCVLPAGTGLNVPLLLVQNGGVLGQGTRLSCTLRAAL